MNSRLWFIKNPHLHDRILAFLARYAEWFGVILYGFIIMGNHYHLVAKFPRCNKAAFCKAFDSIIAKLTGSLVGNFEGGKVWGRPVRCQPLGTDADVKHWVFYVALNPVKSGLHKNLSKYPGYNSFKDAIHGRERKFKIFNREDYNNRKRHNRSLTKEQCMTVHTLKFARLPGFEKMPQERYERELLQELRQRREILIAERSIEGKGFASQSFLEALKPGDKPKTTKTSKRDSKRPLILTMCAATRKRFLEWYFDMREQYRRASARFRAGELDVVFPPGTYRPVLLA